MKLLSANVGYLLDYDGSLSDYVRSPHRALLGGEAAERRALDRLVDVLLEERPDVVCLLEVDGGSYRTATTGQVETMAIELAERGLDYRPRTDPKYGEDGLLVNLPALGDLSNGLLLRDGHPARAHYLDTGPKRLVTEVELAEGLSLFAVHLAMRRSTRERQLDEIAALVADRERAIVCGDFNAYDGHAELDAFCERTGLVLHDPGETVPPRPLDFVVTETRTLDLFLASPDVVVSRCESLDVQVSDHRPIVLEFDA